MERTTDEIYDELIELRLTADRIADNISDVVSAVQYFTNNLFDEQHNPELSDSVGELATFLHRVAAAAGEEATNGVERVTEVVQGAINETLQQTPEEEFLEETVVSVAETIAEEVVENELPALPEMFAWRLKGLVSFLQGEAKKLSAHNLSEEAIVWQWWEQHFEGIRDAFVQLEFLEEKAVGEGTTLRPYVEQWGGIPSSILADEWPLEMVEAVEEWEASDDGNIGSGEGERREEPVERQRALFGEEEGEVLAESGVAVAERIESLETPEETASTEPNEKPSLSEFRESQAEGMDSLNSQHRQELRSATDADLPLSESVYKSFAYEDRVAYAKQCLLADDTDHRAFDTCFEMFDGELVVARLIQLARIDATLAAKIERYQWEDGSDSDLTDFLELPLEQLAEQARFAVEARIASSGDQEPGEELFSETEEDSESQETVGAEPSPYTLEDWQAFQKRLDTGDLTAEELRSQFALMTAHEGPIIEALQKNNNAKDLKNWALRWRGRSESTKKANAEIIFQSMLASFTLSQIIAYRPFDGETYVDAVRKSSRFGDR